MARGSDDDAECGSSEGRPGGLLTPQEEITLTRKVKREKFAWRAIAQPFLPRAPSWRRTSAARQRLREE